jgi:hypothetical protein
MNLQKGDIILSRFQKFNDGYIDTNIHGHMGIIVDIDGLNIKYVLMSSKNHRLYDRSNTVELKRSDVDCIKVKAPISYVKLSDVYEKSDGVTIIGYVSNERKMAEILRKLAVLKEKEERKANRVVAKRRKYQNKSKTLTKNNV